MVNDVTIFGGIIAFFIFLGAVIPFINAEYGTAYVEEDIDGLEDSINSESLNIISVGDVLLSILGIFTWHTGLGWLINIIFLPVKISFYFLLGRQFLLGGA